MRWALGLEYEGSNYHGWQSQQQSTLNTLQMRVEQALSAIANHPVQIICAGRTDRGVHALEQVIHFDTFVARRTQAWVQGGNRFLPADISIRWAQPVPDQFNARYSALARCYRYIIYNHALRPALLRQRVSWVSTPLHVAPMHEAAQFLRGEHDFSAFRAADCQSKTPFRHLQHIHLIRQADFIIMEVKANAFLHHMVRNIAGVLIAIGSGKKPPLWAQQVLRGRNRCLGGITAAPSGLYLHKVIYGGEWELGPVYNAPMQGLVAL